MNHPIFQILRGAFPLNFYRKPPPEKLLAPVHVLSTVYAAEYTIAIVAMCLFYWYFSSISQSETVVSDTLLDSPYTCKILAPKVGVQYLSPFDMENIQLTGSSLSYDSYISHLNSLNVCDQQNLVPILQLDGIPLPRAGSPLEPTIPGSSGTNYVNSGTYRVFKSGEVVGVTEFRSNGIVTQNVFKSNSLGSSDPIFTRPSPPAPITLYSNSVRFMSAQTSNPLKNFPVNVPHMRVPIFFDEEASSVYYFEFDDWKTASTNPSKGSVFVYYPDGSSSSFPYFSQIFSGSTPTQSPVVAPTRSLTMNSTNSSSPLPTFAPTSMPSYFSSPFDIFTVHDSVVYGITSKSRLIGEFDMRTQQFKTWDISLTFPAKVLWDRGAKVLYVISTMDASTSLVQALDLSKRKFADIPGVPFNFSLASLYGDVFSVPTVETFPLETTQTQQIVYNHVLYCHFTRGVPVLMQSGFPQAPQTTSFNSLYVERLTNFFLVPNQEKIVFFSVSTDRNSRVFDIAKDSVSDIRPYMMLTDFMAAYSWSVCGTNVTKVFMAASTTLDYRNLCQEKDGFYYQSPNVYEQVPAECRFMQPGEFQKSCSAFAKRISSMADSTCQTSIHKVCSAVYLTNPPYSCTRLILPTRLQVASNAYSGTLAVWALFITISTICLTRIYGNLDLQVQDTKHEKDIEFSHTLSSAASEMHAAADAFVRRGTVILDDFRHFRNTMESNSISKRGTEVNRIDDIDDSETSKDKTEAIPSNPIHATNNVPEKSSDSVSYMRPDSMNSRL